MKRALFFAWAIAPLFGAEPLAMRLDDLLNKPGLGFSGVQVVQVASGTVLYSHNEQHLMQPASNLKLLTSTLAWDRLKPDYRYRTRVIIEASGDLALVGSGDPSLSGRVIPYDKTERALPPLTAIDELADQIVAAGVERVDGDIVGDDRLYPWDPYPPSWTIDDTANDYGAPVSALSLNESVVKLSLHPGASAGEPATISLSPALEVLTIDNQVTTGPRGARTNIHLQRIPNSSQWRVTGTIATGVAYSELIPVDDPALFAARALYDALVKRGVAISGNPVARHRSAGESYAVTDGREVASRTSPPLSDLLKVMNKVSHNLFAEMFLREVARVSGRDGNHDANHDATSAAGARLLSEYLIEGGNPTNDFHLDDGSGLSRNALVTPRLLARLLAAKANSEDRERWMALLPVGGEDGTLEKRLCCLTQGRNIRAKTGSLDHVAALSGYAQSQTYGLLAFSILLNDFSMKEADARKEIDQIALALLE